LPPTPPTLDPSSIRVTGSGKVILAIMSGFIRVDHHRNAQRARSPSVASDVLSGSVLHSTESPIDASTWVLFSPQASPSNAFPAESTETLECMDQENSFLSSSSHPLELPSHNGAGSFIEPGSKLELFDRINSWRKEQFELQASSESFVPHKKPSTWQRLRDATSNGLHDLFDWDDRTIDALFSKDFGPPERSVLYHLPRAREYGPRGWEDKMTRHAQWRSSDSGLILTLIARILAWSQEKHSSRGIAQKDPGHSYHFAEIQGCIASVTSGDVPWSDIWETSTSSVGMVAA